MNNLEEPIVGGQIKKECTVIQDTLAQYSLLVLESEWEQIRELQLEIDTVVARIKKNKKDLGRMKYVQ